MDKWSLYKQSKKKERTIVKIRTDPGGGMPPRVVVALLWALKPTAVSVGILTSTALVITVDALIGSVQALVALCTLT